jgi:hypothetical protein
MMLPSSRWRTMLGFTMRPDMATVTRCTRTRSRTEIRHLRHRGAVAFHEGDAARTSRGRLRTPPRLRRGQLEHVLEARLLVEEGAPELVGVLARRVSQLVHERLVRERVQGV